MRARSSSSVSPGDAVLGAAAPDPVLGAAAPSVFDRALVRQRRARAARATAASLHADAATFLHDDVARAVIERVSAIKRVFPTTVALGGGDALARAWARDPAARAQMPWLVAADLAPRAEPDAAADADADALRIVADEERSPFADGALAFIASVLSLHAVNDLPGALVQIRRALKPDGLFIGALFGGATLTELRASLLAAEAETGGAGMRVAPFADALDLAGLLQRAGFALPVSDVDRLTVRYATPLELLRDLRAMGETAAMVARSRRPLTRGLLVRMAEHYHARFADPDGKVRATFEIVWATGWAPDASQQKPLKPGTATTRLADALGVTEQSAGEKAGR